MKLFKKIFKDNIGLSMVELIVTIAIMSLVTAGVGAAVISATRNYSKGTSEVNIQTSGQNISNILSNLIIDSAKAASFEDGSANAPDSPTSELYITDVDGGCYAVYYIANVNSNGTGSLYYGQGADYTAARADSHLLADNVVGFSADTSTYSKDYTVHVTIDLYFPGGNRDFRSSFSVTSRNAQASGVELESLDGAVIISDTMVVIEPNEDGNIKDALNIPCYVLTSGAVSNSSFTYKVLTEQSPTTETDVNISSGLTVTYNEASQKFILKASQGINSPTGALYIKVSTNATDASGVPYDTKIITVYIRRAQSASINKDETNSTTDTNIAGAKHVVTGKLNVSNPDRYYALKSDNDYVSPHDVVWTVTSNASTYISSVVSNDDASGTNLLSAMLGGGYFGKSGETFTIIVKENLPKGTVVTFTMTAVHPKGTMDGYAGFTNKASITTSSKQSYSDVYATYEIVAGFWPEISDYQRGNTDTIVYPGFSSGAGGSVFDDVFKTVYSTYEGKRDADPTGSDAYGKSYQSVLDWLNDFRNGSVPFTIGYFYRISDYTIDPVTGVKTYYRYDENGNLESSSSRLWTSYKTMKSSDTNAAFSTEISINLLRVDHYQDIEFMAVLYNGNTILWPREQDLLDYGFDGFTFGEYAASVTKEKSTYAYQFTVVPASIEYINTEIFGSEFSGSRRYIGSTSNPVILGNEFDKLLSYDKFGWVGLGFNNFQNRLGYKLQKYTEADGWKTVGTYGKTDAQNKTFNEYGYQMIIHDTGYEFVTKNVNINAATFDYGAVYRMIPTIHQKELGYTKKSDGVFNNTIYYLSEKFDYILSTDNEQSTNVESSIVFKRTAESSLSDMISYTVTQDTSYSKNMNIDGKNYVGYKYIVTVTNNMQNNLQVKVTVSATGENVRVDSDQNLNSTSESASKQYNTNIGSPVTYEFYVLNVSNKDDLKVELSF